MRLLASGFRLRVRGFTLLEVLVAVAILGLGLTAILSAQFSAVAGVSHARYINVAVGLARCKMTEIEDALRVDGFQELDQQDNGVCCEGDEGHVYTCSWSVEKPTFPPPNFGELNLDTQLDSSALGKLAEAGETGGLPAVANAASATPDLTSLVSGGVGGVAQLVMNMVYPDLKALFEASTRRVTVVVGWTEGNQERDLTVAQWVTHPKPPSEEEVAGAIQQGLQGASSAAPTGTPAPGATGTPAPTPRPGGALTTPAPKQPGGGMR